MSLQTSTLRPGFLVSLKTSVRGNVSYDKEIIKPERTDADGARRETWQTERTVAEPAEFVAAQETRSLARSAISRVCTPTAFGLLCPEDAGATLETAIAEARDLAAAFNATAKLTRVNVYVMTGRVAQDDVSAVKAINSEVRDLMEDMQEGLANLDVKKIRDAAFKAKQIGNMLTPDAAARVQVAVDAARAAATRIRKAGEQAAVEVDRLTIKRIGEQRTAFLDLDEAKAVARPKAAAVAVDLAPAADAPKPKRRKSGPQLELE